MAIEQTLLHMPGIAGADEAGRGPIAGPVCCAAVLLPDDFDVTGLNDSKKMTERQRDEQVKRLRFVAHAIEFVSHEEIDEINILQASLVGMARAVARLDPAPRSVLVDGNQVPKQICCPVTPVIQGDGIYAAIAAASILAKTARDALMREWAKKYPEYGFEHNFGYPTQEHLAALSKHGPCPIHRRSFAPVFRELEQPCLALGV